MTNRLSYFEDNMKWILYPLIVVFALLCSCQELKSLNPPGKIFFSPIQNEIVFGDYMFGKKNVRKNIIKKSRGQLLTQMIVNKKFFDLTKRSEKIEIVVQKPKSQFIRKYNNALDLTTIQLQNAQDLLFEVDNGVSTSIN